MSVPATPETGLDSLPILLAAIARWQGLPLEAVAHLHQRLLGGVGGMAQFSHPALGGMGQWIRGGVAMLPLGVPDDLRQRVTRALEMLADLPPPDAGERTASSGGPTAPARLPARPVSLSPSDGQPCCPHCGGGLLLPGARAESGRAAFVTRPSDGAGIDGGVDPARHRPTASLGDRSAPPAHGIGPAPAVGGDTPARGFWQSGITASATTRLADVAPATFHRAPVPLPDAPRSVVVTAESPGRHRDAPVHGGVPPGHGTKPFSPHSPPLARTEPMEPMKPMAPMKPMEPMQPMKPMAPMQPTTPWWPDGLGSPSTTGGQNDMDYAVFPDKHRLAVKAGGKVTLYDTAGKAIHGAGQSQATGKQQGLAFSTDSGTVQLADLKEVNDAG